MIIRKAVLEDRDNIIVLIDEFYEESIKQYGLSIDPETMYRTVENVIINHIALVAEQDKNIVGVIGGLIINSIFDDRDFIAQELMWYVNKDWRKGRLGLELMRKFEEECKNKKIKFIIMSSMENLNAGLLNKLYKIRNFKLMENQYIKEF